MKLLSSSRSFVLYWLQLLNAPRLSAARSCHLRLLSVRVKLITFSWGECYCLVSWEHSLSCSDENETMLKKISSFFQVRKSSRQNWLLRVSLLHCVKLIFRIKSTSFPDRFADGLMLLTNVAHPHWQCNHESLALEPKTVYFLDESSEHAEFFTCHVFQLVCCTNFSKEVFMH